MARARGLLPIMVLLSSVLGGALAQATAPQLYTPVGPDEQALHASIRNLSLSIEPDPLFGNVDLFGARSQNDAWFFRIQTGNGGDVKFPFYKPASNVTSSATADLAYTNGLIAATGEQYQAVQATFQTWNMLTGVEQGEVSINYSLTLQYIVAVDRQRRPAIIITTMQATDTLAFNLICFNGTDTIIKTISGHDLVYGSNIGVLGSYALVLQPNGTLTVPTSQPLYPAPLYSPVGADEPPLQLYVENRPVTLQVSAAHGVLRLFDNQTSRTVLRVNVLLYLLRLADFLVSNVTTSDARDLAYFDRRLSALSPQLRAKQGTVLTFSGAVASDGGVNVFDFQYIQLLLEDDRPAFLLNVAKLTGPNAIVEFTCGFSGEPQQVIPTPSGATSGEFAFVSPDGGCYFNGAPPANAMFDGAMIAPPTEGQKINNTAVIGGEPLRLYFNPDAVALREASLTPYDAVLGLLIGGDDGRALQLQDTYSRLIVSSTNETEIQPVASAIRAVDPTFTAAQATYVSYFDLNAPASPISFQLVFVTGVQSRPAVVLNFGHGGNNFTYRFTTRLGESVNGFNLPRGNVIGGSNCGTPGRYIAVSDGQGSFAFPAPR